MSATFIEAPRFPDEVAAWATGGRGFKTDVVETYGGNEFRNAAWSQQRGEWEVQNAWRSADQSALHASHNQSVTLSFFRMCMGQLYAFRFKDFWDFTDSMNGGTGVFVMLTATTFQMYKQYSVVGVTGGTVFNQIIQKPVNGTIVVTGGSGVSVDSTTGIVSVSSGTPTSWTGQFDIPCRFATDMPDLGLDESSGALLNWKQCKVIEVRNY